MRKTLITTILFVVACKDSGPLDKKFELTDSKGAKVAITGTVPAGWSYTYGSDYNYINFNTEDDDGLDLTMAEVMLVEDETTPASLGDLAAAVGAKFKVNDRETTPTGFGVTFNNGSKDLFVYYATVNGRSFSCKPGRIGYDAKFLATCKQICASLR